MPNLKPDKRVSYSRVPKPIINLPYRIRRVGRNRYINYHSTCSTYNQDATINIFINGIGHYYKGDEYTMVQQGDVLLATGEGEEGFLFADKKQPYDHFYCRFTGHEALKAAKRISQNFGRGSDVFAWNRWEVGVECLKRMVLNWHEHMRHPIDRLTLADAILAELLAELDCVETEERTITKEHFLNAYEVGHLHDHIDADILNDYMLDHIHDQIDLDEMATYFGISKSHLCRLAKTQLGQPIGKTWEQLKVDWAKTLLIETQARISEVAYHVGFLDQFYFSRVFKKHTGKSPKIWQKEQNEKNRT